MAALVLKQSSGIGEIHSLDLLLLKRALLQLKLNQLNRQGHTLFLNKLKSAFVAVYQTSFAIQSTAWGGYSVWLAKKNSRRLCLLYFKSNN